MADTVLQLIGGPNLEPMPWTGGYLQSVDFEAHDGMGEVVMTRDPARAKRFTDIIEAMTFLTGRPICRPNRPDGLPNRPLTSTTWGFPTLEPLS